MKLDIYAPIVPYFELGGIKLYETRENLKDILTMPGVIKGKPWGGLVEYSVEDKISFLFCTVNDKLCKMSALEGYKGTGPNWLGCISVGMTKEELLRAEPSFVYDDFEECWITHKGASVTFDYSTQRVSDITIWVAEIHRMDLGKGNW